MSCIQRSFICFSALLLLFSFQLVQPIVGIAQENLCDPSLDSSAGDPLGYYLRGDRCEGRYSKGVTGTVMVASMTGFFEDYDVSSGEALTVEWIAPQTPKVYLRAQGVRPRLYYRMDTLRPSGSTSYRWSTDILRNLGISRNDIGVIGWTTYSMSGVIRAVYLPLRIWQKQQAAQSQTYRVVLWPDTELTEVFVSLATVNRDGSPRTFLEKWDGKPLGYGYYPAFQGIEFKIADLETPGIYYLEISATLTRGGSVTIENWFYHAGS